jgi:V8-like Glu-specific endopeptidase
MQYNGTIQTLYVAYYGRPADPSGYRYWHGRLETEDLATVERAFGHSVEFDQRFGGMDGRTLIDNIYRNLFNRAPEEGGLNYYADGLATGRFDLPEIARRIAEGAQGKDQLVLDNKLLTAARFSETVWDDNAESTTAVGPDQAAAFLRTVDATSPPKTAEILAQVDNVKPTTMTIDQALAVDGNTPPYYRIVDLDGYTPSQPLTVEAATSLFEEVKSITQRAENRDDLDINALLDWRIADALPDLRSARGTAILENAEAYQLTEPAGRDLGFVDTTSLELLVGATNYTDYLFRPSMDGRDGRQWPAEDVVSPVVVQIESTFSANGRMYISQGSGVLVGPNDVLTAAHVVHNNQTNEGWADEVMVAPGSNRNEDPFGRYEVEEVFGYPVETFGGRISLQQSTYDMALLHLKEPLGYQYGYMDIGVDVTAANGIATAYPGTAGGEQVSGEATITERVAHPVVGGRSYWIYDSPAQNPGSSGGPIWLLEDRVPTVAGNISTSTWAYDVANDVEIIGERVLQSNSLIDSDWTLAV